MIKKELVEMLKAMDDNAKIFASDIYNEGHFEITGAVYNKDKIELTREDLS